MSVGSIWRTADLSVGSGQSVGLFFREGALVEDSHSRTSLRLSSVIREIHQMVLSGVDSTPGSPVEEAGMSTGENTLNKEILYQVLEDVQDSLLI